MFHTRQVKASSPDSEFLNYDIMGEDYTNDGSRGEVALAIPEDIRKTIVIANGSKEDQKRQLYWLIGQLQAIAEVL